MLSAAAVLGTQFAVGAVIDMAGISDSDAMDALDVAEAAGLLAEVGARTPTLRFVHVLVARAVYGGLPRGRRRRLHAQAAEVLAKRAGAPTIHLAAQIARQYNLGGMLAEARSWATTAGDYAAGQLSPAEAARWYRTALDHGATLDVPDHERAGLLVRLGHAQQQAGDPSALATLTEAAALARGCGATAIVAQAAGQVVTHLGPAAADAGRLASLLGRHDVADQYLNTAFEIADAFDWDYHRAAILMARAAARHRSFGQIDDTARAWLQTAAGICVARGPAGHARRDRRAEPVMRR